MFCPPPEGESSTNAKTHNSRKQKKKSPKKKQFNKYYHHNLTKKKSKFAATMCSWAENFTVAATWQLKHQLAYWKAKATSLEYENRILHDIIRKNHCQPSSENEAVASESDSEETAMENYDKCYETPHEEEVPEDEEEFEVSEEFIEFLRSNAKFKEDARLERERFKAKCHAVEQATEETKAGPSKKDDPSVELKKLYGAKWQHVGALEMYLHSQFIQESDKEKPAYWPNIPFNFNFD